MIITAGKYKGQKIFAPDENITRPTLSKVRMSVFNILNSIIDFDEKSFLDMYAGSGIMGLEAISRGFGRVVAFEKNPKIANIIKKNYAKFSYSPDLIIGDSVKLISKIDEKFDVIYIDPPYFSGAYEQSLRLAKTKSKGIIILEHVTQLDFSEYNLIKQKKYGDKYITFLENFERI